MLHFLLESLITPSQVIVVAIMLFVLFRAYRHNVFMVRLAGTTLALEILLVALYLFEQHTSGHIAEEIAEEAPYLMIAIAHGIISLAIMVLSLIFFVLAYRAQRQGENFFKTHPVASGFFAVGWITSLLSGIVL